MNKCIRPLLSPFKNACILRRLPKNIFTSKISYSPYIHNVSLVKSVSYTFSQQNDDPNGALKK